MKQEIRTGPMTFQEIFAAQAGNSSAQFMARWRTMRRPRQPGGGGGSAFCRKLGFIAVAAGRAGQMLAHVGQSQAICGRKPLYEDFCSFSAQQGSPSFLGKDWWAVSPSENGRVALRTGRATLYSRVSTPAPPYLLESIHYFERFFGT